MSDKPKVLRDPDGNRVPTEPMTKHKTWATYVASLVVSVLTSLLARWGFDLSADATALLLILMTPAVGAFAAHMAQNYKLDFTTGFHCHPVPIVLGILLAGALAGCSPGGAGGVVVDVVQDRIEGRQGLFGDADRAALEATLLSYNEAGVDPLQMDPQQLRWLDLGCVTLLLVDPDPVLISDCNLVRRALAAAGEPAAPAVAPLTAPEPVLPPLQALG